MPISRKNGSTRSRNPRVSALVGLPVAVSPGLLDELLDPALAKPFEGGKVRFPVWDVAQAPGEPDGILHRQRGALPRSRQRRVCYVPDQAHRVRGPAGQRGHIVAWPTSYRTVVEANDLCYRSAWSSGCTSSSFRRHRSSGMA